MTRPLFLSLVLGLSGCTIFADAGDVPTADAAPDDAPPGADAPADAAGSDGGVDTQLPGAGADGGDPVPLDSPCETDLERVDTSQPDRIVGTGTAESCSYEALQAAVAAGGVITFDCGGSAVIDVTSELKIEVDTVIDGGGAVTLSGGGANRILKIEAQRASTRPEVTLQNLTLRDGYHDPSETTACGAALFRVGGTLDVVDVRFLNNVCDGEGEGGAVFSNGAHPTRFLRARFSGNSADSGGAMKETGESLAIIDSEFVGNSAANNGGLLSSNGEVALCGVTFADNTVTGEQAAMIHNFGTADDGLVVIDHTVFARNHADGGRAGLYVFGEGTVKVQNSSFVDNVATGSTALRVGAGRLELVSTTIARNIATAGQAAGLALYSGATGTVEHATIVENETLEALTFEAGIGGSDVIEISNSIVASNRGANVPAPQNCGETHVDGGGNLQFPRNKENGDPDVKCADGVLFADPQLSQSDDGLSYVPAPDSPAVGIGVDCATTDQFGNPRPVQGCTAGAIEVGP